MGLNAQDDRLTQLRSLLQILAEKINDDPGARDMAGLAKQYRETLKEIEGIDGGKVNVEDEIEKLISRRVDSGKPGAVRKSRTKVPTDGRSGRGGASTTGRTRSRSVAKKGH